MYHHYYAWNLILHRGKISEFLFALDSLWSSINLLQGSVVLLVVLSVGSEAHQLPVYLGASSSQSDSLLAFCLKVLECWSGLGCF